MASSSTTLSFIETFRRSEPRLWLEDPEITKEGLVGKQVVRYKVMMSGGLTGHDVNGVMKRYSDFETLRNTLCKRYSSEGMLVPALPRKVLLGNKTDDFIKERMRGLTLFVEALSCSPFLLNDAAFARFIITTPEAPDRKGDKKGDVDDDSDANIGDARWREYVASFPAPLDVEPQLTKVLRELDSTERSLKGALEATKTLTSGISQISKALTGFSEAMHVFAGHEKMTEALNDLTPEPTNSVYHLAESTLAMARGVNEGCLHTEDQVELFFSEILNYELAQVQGLRSLIKGRDALTFNLEKLQKRLSTLQTMAMSPTNKDKAKNEKATVEEQLGAEEDGLQKYDKALVWYTVPLYARERNVNLNRAFSILAAITASSATAAYTSSLTYLRALQVDPAAIVHDVNESAARLAIHPVGPLTADHHHMTGAPTPVGSSVVDMVQSSPFLKELVAGAKPLTPRQSVRHVVQSLSSNDDVCGGKATWEEDPDRPDVFTNVQL